MEEELLKLPPTIPEESLAQVLQSLWRTRETGLGSADRARIQSLLSLPTLQHLGPPLWKHTRVSNQVRIKRPPPFASSTASELSSLLWPREDDATAYPKNSATPSNVVANLPSLSSMPHNQDHCSLDGLLQDYSKSSSGEIEVKFQLSKDSLEAMLRSMTHLSERLSNSAASPSEPSAKKQKQ